MAEGLVRPPSSVSLLLMKLAYLTNITHRKLKGHSWGEWGMKKVCMHRNTNIHMHAHSVPLTLNITQFHNPRIRSLGKHSNKLETITLRAFLNLITRVLQCATSLFLLSSYFWILFFLVLAVAALVLKFIPSFVTKRGLLDRLEWFTCIVILANFFSLLLRPQQSICISIASLSACILLDIMSALYEFKFNVCICCCAPKAVLVKGEPYEIRLVNKTHRWCVVM